MKKLLIVTALVLVAGIAFGQTSKTATVDIEAEKAALNEIMDKLDSEAKDGDWTVFVSLLTEDALFCGTDPSEFWNKQYFVDLSKQDSYDPTPELKYIGDRKIKIATDGNSAIVVTQYIAPGYSPKIPWRHVYHFVKSNDKWMILFINIAFIPYNEDIQKLNEAID
jgi:hypothetical protein